MTKSCRDKEGRLKKIECYTRRLVTSVKTGMEVFSRRTSKESGKHQLVYAMFFIAVISSTFLAGGALLDVSVPVSDLPIRSSITWSNQNGAVIPDFANATVSGTISAAVSLFDNTYQDQYYIYTVTGMYVAVYAQLPGGGYATKAVNTFNGKGSGASYTVPVDTTRIPNGAYRFDVVASVSSVAIPFTVRVSTQMYSQVPALTVYFTTSITGGVPPFTFSWDFGDGSASVATQSPSHVYTQSGQYSVVVKVTDSSDQTTSASIGVGIPATPVLPLSVSALATPVSGVAPLQVTFTSVVGGGVSPYTYLWGFSDGSVSTTANPSHTYASPGSYTATVTVTDSEGTKQSGTAGVVVSTPTPALACSISANPSSGDYPLTVTFSAIVSGGILPYTQYSWLSGDGGGQLGGYTWTHTYQTAGTFLVSLMVTDSAGVTVSSSVTINVSTPPPPPSSNSLAVSVSKTRISGTASSDTFQFSPTVTGGVGGLSYQWSMGEGDTSTLQSPIKTFYSGTYTVSCRVTDGAGNSAQGSTTFTLTYTPTTGPVIQSFFTSFSTKTNGATYMTMVLNKQPMFPIPTVAIIIVSVSIITGLAIAFKKRSS